MKEKILFEIPIYLSNEKKFSEKWDKFFKNYNKSEADMNLIKEAYYPQTIWKYNQIIGVITINLTKKDILFKCYYTNKNRTTFNSKQKHFFRNIGLNGYHFPIKNTWSSAEIKEEIIEWLTSLQRDKFKNKFVDMSVFLEQLKYIDMKKVIEDIQY